MKTLLKKAISGILAIANLIALSACNKTQTDPNAEYIPSIVDAVKLGSLEAVKEAVEAGADVNTTHREIYTFTLPRQVPILGYALENNPTIAKYLIDQGADVNFNLIEGTLAVQRVWEHVGITTDFMVSKGADVNAVNLHGLTPLDYAMLRTVDEQVQPLLAAGAKPTAQTLELLLEGKHTPSPTNLQYVVNSLTEQGIEFEIDPLIHAALLGDDNEVIRLSKLEASTDDIDLLFKGRLIARFCSLNALIAFIQENPTINTDNYLPYFAIEAVSKGDSEMVIWLSRNISYRNHEILNTAVNLQQYEIIDLLLARGYSIAPPDWGRSFPLECALKTNDIKILQQFLDSDLELNYEHESSIINQIYFDINPETLEILLQAQILSDKSINSLYTNFVLFNKEEYAIELLELCVKYGANPIAVSDLAFISSHYTIEKIKFLLDNGNSPDDITQGNGSAIYGATKAGDYDTVKLLLESGADPNVTFLGDAPLNIAARAGKNIASLLIEYGADINAQDENGETPLINAVRHKNLWCAELLIEAGCDISIKNNKGYVAADYVSDTGIAEMKELFGLEN